MMSESLLRRAHPLGACSACCGASRVAKGPRCPQLPDHSGLAAMSHADREIPHLAGLLLRLSTGLRAEDADRYLIRDAQRVIELIEALVRLHDAQEEDIYEHAMPA